MILQSRCLDDTGYRQPDRATLVAVRGVNSVYHYNANEAPRSKLRGITELNSEDFSEGEANPVASYGECQVQSWHIAADGQVSNVHA